MKLTTTQTHKNKSKKISDYQPNLEKSGGEPNNQRDPEQKVRQRLSFLLEASELLSKSLDYRETLNTLAKICVPKISDWCAIDFKENGKVSLLEVTHINPKKISWARKYREQHPVDLKSQSAIAKVLTTGISEFYPEVTEEMLLSTAINKKQIKLIQKIGLKSIMIVPIRSGEQIYGSVTFVSSTTQNLYTYEDLLLVEDLGRKAGLAIEKAKLHEELKISRDNLNAILENVAEGISVQNPVGRLLFANDTAAHLTGFKSAEELLNTPTEKIMEKFEIFDERDNPMSVMDLPGRLALQGKPSKKVVKFRTKRDNTARYSEVLATPVFDENNKVRFAINVFRDITESKFEEEQLRSSEEKWKSVVQDSPDYILNIDEKHNILFVNKPFPGIPSERIIGTNVYNFIPIQYHSIIRKTLKNCFKTGKPSSYEIEALGHEGHSVWYRSRVGVIKDGNNKVLALTIISTDITEFKKAQEIVQLSQRALEKKVFERTSELQKSIRKLTSEISKRKKIAKELSLQRDFSENLLKSSVDGILAFDRNCRYTLWNPGMERIARKKAKEVLGKVAFEIFPSLARSGEDKYFLKALQGKSVMSRDREHIINPEGEKHFYEAYYSPIFSEDREVLGGICIVRDITERKLLEEAKLNALRELERAKSEFVALASHELRTPLTIINGYFDLLVNGDLGNFEGTSQNFQMYIEKMYRETKRLSKLVEDLLNTSRIEDGRLKLSFERIHLTDVLNEVVGELKPLASAKGIQLSAFNKLNGLSESLTIMADRGKLKQIFVNLVDNAITYNKPEGKVKVKTYAKGEKVFIEVKDTGIGIESKLIPRVFQKFQQAHGSYLKENKGTGLGLFIVKSLVELQNGNISVKSKVGKGSSFIVDLPISLKKLSKKELLN